MHDALGSKSSDSRNNSPSSGNGSKPTRLHLPPRPVLKATGVPLTPEGRIACRPLHVRCGACNAMIGISLVGILFRFHGKGSNPDGSPRGSFTIIKSPHTEPGFVYCENGHLMSFGRLGQDAVINGVPQPAL